MRWASVMSTQTNPDVALGVLLESMREQMAGDPTNLMLVFGTGHSEDSWSVFMAELRVAFPEATILGCSAGGVIGGGREVETGTAISVTAAHLPDVAVVGFHHDGETSASVSEAALGWQARLGLEPEHQPSFLLIPDPFSCDPVQLLQGLDRAYPAATKLGGLASGGDGPGDHILALDDQMHRSGAVGVALYGDIEVATVVAQGCRPVGDPMVITRCENNLLIELNGESALGQLERFFGELDAEDQTLFRALPMVGVGMEKGRGSYRQGDFLIRHLMGMDRTNGVLAVGAMMDEGQVIQFHVRDAESSRQDLEELLTQHTRTHAVDQSEGALLFSCLGRGKRFFGVPDHDLGMATRYLGGVPIGGFFCAGEIGPVNGQTWLHGYTSALGIFRSRGWS